MAYTLNIDDTTIDYLMYGSGSKNLVIIPGLSFKTIRFSGLVYAFKYRSFFKDFKVYIIDRRKVVKEGFTVTDEANDVLQVINRLGLKDIYLLGISSGASIALELSLMRKDLVKKLVVASAFSRLNDTSEYVLNYFIRLARREEFSTLRESFLNRCYTKNYLIKNNLKLNIFLKRVNKLNSIRFINLVKACLTVDIYDRLEEIKCPLLVIVGSLDNIVTARAGIEISLKNNANIYIYDNFGHGVFDEASDFNKRCHAFFLKK